MQSAEITQKMPSSHSENLSYIMPFF
jgi:hypothetical protein